MLQAFSLALALYQQMNIAIALILFIFCVSIGLWGAIRARISLPQQRNTLARFPNHVDDIIVVILLLMLLGNSISAYFVPAPANGGFHWLDLALLGLLYLPVLVRVFFDHSHVRVRLGFVTVLQLIAATIGLTWGVSFASVSVGLFEFFTQYCGSPQEQDVFSALSGDWYQKFIIIVASVVMAPVLEECLFRGMLYPCLKRYVSSRIAAILTGLLFGAVHMALPQLIPLSFLGIALCYLYERAQSLWLPILVHMIFNAISLSIALFLVPIGEELMKNIQSMI